MRIIAVMSPKGGIGKTTTSDAIAYMLGEEQEKRVLILDGDPQGDTSKTFEAYEPEGTGMSELLERHVSVGGSYRTTDLIRPTQYSHIDIIPANGYLMQTDMKLLLKQEANQVTRLRDALEEISEAYDYCICDCGRLLDMVVINILLAAEPETMSREHRRRTQRMTKTPQTRIRRQIHQPNRKTAKMGRIQSRTRQQRNSRRTRSSFRREK